MSSLFEVDKTLMEMLEQGFNEQCVNVETGEIDEIKVQQFLNDLPIEREKKLEAYGCIIRNLLTEAKGLKEAEESFEKRRKQKEKRAEYLKQSVINSMLAFGETKHEFTNVAFSFRKSSALEIENSEFIPKEFINVEIKEKPKAREITEYLKNGGEIKGVRIVERQNLQIK